jgi:acetate kinase
MPRILTINGGSSSLRFAYFKAARRPIRLLEGKFERLGAKNASLSAGKPGESAAQIKLGDGAGASGADAMLRWLNAQPNYSTPDAIGHRVVHGMTHAAPELVTMELIQELRKMTAFDPEHLPREIGLIEAMQEHYRDLPQVLCFDTTFHRDMPQVATQLPIPRRYAEKGLRRYGFHGLSFTYLMQELRRLDDPAASDGRVILAHLGNGASLAAVRNGRCIDTSMGFTPTAGLVMGTRSGDLDPGLMSYLAIEEGMSAKRLQTLVNHESGLVGVSGTSSDARDLLAVEASDPRAREALELFCYQAKKWIGSFAAALGGLDTLVFAGGIGEHAAPLRRRICEGLEFLGIDIDHAANAVNAATVSSKNSAVSVRIIRTDEESVIAESTARVLRLIEEGDAACSKAQ